MKSRHEEIATINALLATRYLHAGDSIRAALQVAKLNHHTVSAFVPDGDYTLALCQNCGARLRLWADGLIGGPASDFTCEQIQEKRRR